MTKDKTAPKEKERTMKFKLYMGPYPELDLARANPFEGVFTPDQTVGLADSKGKVKVKPFTVKREDAAKDEKGYFIEIDEKEAWTIVGNLPSECNLVMVK